MFKPALLAFSLFCVPALSLAQTAVPTVNAPLVPTAVAPGSAAFTLTVNGTGFVSGAAVEWNGTALATTFVSSSRLTAQVPAADVTTASTATITVVNPGVIAASNSTPFAVVTKNSAISFANAIGTPFPVFPTAVNSNAIFPVTTVSGDFNGDGILDLAVETYEQNAPGYTVIFYAGKGDGTFTQGTSISVAGSTPGTMIVGDFNGDGKADIAVLDYTANKVTVLLGNGNGTFTAAPSAPTGPTPLPMISGDWNHDGKLDLAVANNDSTVSILLGNGDGSFTPAPGSPLSTGSVLSFAVGDFNRDGNLDLAVSNDGSSSTTSIQILAGHGDGTFTPGTPILTPQSFSLVAADFNGDGKLDLAVPDTDTGAVQVFLGNGDGTFNAVPSCCGSQDYQNHIYSTSVADFDGDGKLDLAMLQTNVSSNTTFETVWRGAGDGTFSPTNFSIALAQSTFAQAIGDFNGDGRLDVVTVDEPYSQLFVQLQVTGGPAPDFSVTQYNPGTVTVSPGSSSTFFIDANSLNGFLGSVTVACAGAPSEASCAVQPSSQTIVDTGNASYQVIVSTTAPSTTTNAIATPPPSALWPLGLGAIAGSLLLLGWYARRHLSSSSPARAFALVPLVLVLGSIALFSSCGSNGPTRQADPGTPAGTYTLTFTGTSGTLTHTTTVTLVVQ